MSNDKAHAERLLNEAARVILKDRPGVHGDTENSFEMIAEQWTTYITHKRRTSPPGEEFKITPVDVAFMMGDLKTARYLYGDRKNPDNFVDRIGYTALAGMLAADDTVPGQTIGEALEILHDRSK